MAGVGYVENMKLQKGDYPAIHTYANDKRRQLAQRIRFVKTEYKGEPVFGIICDHERQVKGQLAKRVSAMLATGTAVARLKM